MRDPTAKYMVLMFSVFNSRAGAQCQVLPSLCLHHTQHPYIQQLYLPFTRLSKQFDGSWWLKLSSNTVFAHSTLWKNNYPSKYLCKGKTMKNSKCDQLFWKTQMTTVHSQTAICFRTTSYLSCFFPMGSFLKLMQWLWLFKTNLNLATSWTGSMNPPKRLKLKILNFNVFKTGIETVLVFLNTLYLSAYI